jgi:hypothetical protein
MKCPLLSIVTICKIMFTQSPNQMSEYIHTITKVHVDLLKRIYI